ncbi:MAG TPA: hypothetical protein VIS74_05165 [Chthoniobacterales bacterium]
MTFTISFGDYEICEFCGKEQIRFVHYLQHPDWKDTIAVGRICASDLSGDPKADSAERRLRNLAKRRANFLKLKSWKTSAKGNVWIEYQDHHIIVIKCRNGKFTLRIDGEAGKLFFPDRHTAMLRAFDVVMRKIRRER